ncbi:hypothetical protein NW762_010929 [Fusarium torreyae]|uniref:Glycoside hydrolase family 3 N-terminal domain-containing protein n=1 Tax=Fusarium torreyae TaxID=1237075 RepID=A0A9W8RQB9_9HYPO|nr:hypothetical protein NW762_010929 [Fusarium torreyae]
MSEASVEIDDTNNRISDDNLDWAIGQVLFMGWNGSEVTPHIRKLIEEYHVGAIVLTANNLRYQENGGLNALFDEELICGFPSAMGIAATGNLELAYKTSKSTAEALKACGVNMIVGPVLDILLNTGYQPIGVRCFGDDPKEVSAFGIAVINGFKDAGLATCGKHFPACGSLNYLGSSLDMPIITQTMEELQSSTLVPFRSALATGNLDSMFVSGSAISNPAINIPHACLSSEIVDDLLRQDLGFEGVAISDCLEMEALSQDLGIQNGVVMALEAGCDLILLCRSFDTQLEAIKALELGISNVHENLIKKASTIIIVTTNATRNLYQASFAKYVDLMCSMFRAQGRKKSVILVAVSSPYDFVMDRTIGTYLCTFDFTENAMQALVRVLCGYCLAEGSLPGILRKTKKVAKSRQNWIVQEYDQDRDEPYLKELLQAVWQSNPNNLKQLEWTTPASFNIFSSTITQKHFVVRNSSTKMLFGFLATYNTEDTGILAAVTVHPEKRKSSIGRSLYRRAILHFRTQPNLIDVQIGSCFPGIFMGISLDDDSSENWLRSLGWKGGRGRSLNNYILENLSTWRVPDGIVAQIRQAEIGFDLVQGSDHSEADQVLDLVYQQEGQEIVELYKLALTGAHFCGIIRAKAVDGSILGTAIVCAPTSPFSAFMPVLASGNNEIGGILAPVSFNKPQSTLVLQALTLMGVRQNKSSYRAQKTLLSLVS